MAGFNLFAEQTSVSQNEGWRATRGTKRGELFIATNYFGWVLEGKVFAANAGDVTTGISGHTAIDADQPEMAVRVPDGTIAIPIQLYCSLETGSATLGVGGMMCAVSGIDVGNGTSTAVDIVNLRLDAPSASSCVAREAYTANGTDPLTAGNFIELLRQGFILDSDAATSGFTVPTLVWRAIDCGGASPIVMDAGSILVYAEHAPTAPTVFAGAMWGEFSESGFI